MKGSVYSAAILRPETFAGSPAEYMFTPFFDDACFIDARTAAVLRSLFGPSSHVTFSTRRPSKRPKGGGANTRHGRIVDFAEVAHTSNLLRILVIEACTLPADYRAPRQHRVFHPRHAEVDPKYRLALHLCRRVHPRQPLSNNLVVLALLESHIARDRQRRSFREQIAIT